MTRRAEILKVLRDGGCIKPHTVGKKSCFRLTDAAAHPVRNITQVQMRHLIKHQLVKKEGDVYSYLPQHFRKFGKVEFKCTFKDHGKWYVMKGYDTLGRAKYAFWKLIVEQKPSVPYRDVRGRKIEVVADKPTPQRLLAL